MFWRSTICCATIGILLLAGCRHPPKAEAKKVQRSQPLLGTFVTITVYGQDRSLLHKAISAAFDEFRRVDELLSIHRPDSELARLNDLAAAQPVEVSEELYRIMALAKEISEQTQGAFDPTIGPLADLWGFIWKEHRLPSSSELKQVLPLVDYKKVRLHQRKAEFLQEGMFLDFGGIGKGYAVDRAIEVLRAQGVKSAMVKAGGDLRVLGLPPHSDSWEVQIEDPRKQGGREVVQIQAGALSTSGNYENFFEVDGRRYSHIVNPKTGLPIQGIASCTVTAGTCLETDALATAFFVLGPHESMSQFGEKYGIRFVVLNQDDQSLKVIQTPAFPDFR